MEDRRVGQVALVGACWICAEHIADVNLRISQERVLSRVDDLRIDCSRLTRIEGGNVITGGYGNVWFATLDQGRSNSVLVAVKELQQEGSFGERIRVAIVSVSILLFHIPCQRVTSPQGLARELKIWAAMKHPNILPLIGFYLAEDMKTALLISPYFRHGHIGEYLKKVKPTLLQRLQLVGLKLRKIILCSLCPFYIKALDTAAGLRYLHEREPPICHADLKSV